MTAEIAALEEKLRQAELGPDPAVFEELLADDVVMVSDGQPAFAKARIVDAHQPGKGPKFSRVELRDLQIVDHGPAAVTTGACEYEAPKGAFTLRFMRVWLETGAGWRIIAGSVSGPV